MIDIYILESLYLYSKLKLSKKLARKQQPHNSLSDKNSYSKVDMKFKKIILLSQWIWIY